MREALEAAQQSEARLREALEVTQESEARLRAKYVHTPVPLHALDAEGRIVEASDRWLSLMGYAREEVLGRHIAEFQEDGGEQLRAQWDELMERGEIRDAERRFVRRDGTVLDVLVSLRLVPATSGHPLRILGAVVDVTDRRRAEAALGEAEEKLRQSQRMEALGQLGVPT